MPKRKGVKLGNATGQRLEALARIRGGSSHWLICRAMEPCPDRDEKYEQQMREDARWERFQLTGEAVSHDKAAVWLENLAQGKVSVFPR